MRHEKISPADHVTLLASLILPDVAVQRPADKREEEAKGPPVYVKHFYYCGRSTTRVRAVAIMTDEGGKEGG